MASPCRALWRTTLQVSNRRLCHRPTRSRNLSSAPWHTQTTHAASRVQVYTSRSHDPFLNLSAEHFLLQNSHPDSTILFLYTNDPCVVIGRNQNPWVEVNLGLLARFRAAVGVSGGGDGGVDGDGDDSNTHVSLVRRRSGGGAVFHDHGNVNFSVICPPAVFDRNKHAEMVVRALRGLGIATAQVNKRHDIVVVAGPDEAARAAAAAAAAAAAGSSGEHSSGGSAPTFKISGSAYKLTRLRSLHHGTCLLSSPNLADIGRLLRSPAEPYIKARGVESVRSKIRNVDLTSDEFIEAVTEEFRAMYGGPDVEVAMGGGMHAPDFQHDQIQKGYQELTSREWIFDQTPQFTFSTHPSEDDPRARPPFPPGIPGGFHATITARHGQIQHAEMSNFDGSSLEGQNLHTIADWCRILHSGSGTGSDAVGKWFNHLFGTSGDGL